MGTRVTAKGQVTIPAEIRAAARIGAGTELEWQYDEAFGRIVAVRANARRQTEQTRLEEALRAIDQVRGSADAGLSTEDVLRITRDWGA